MNWLDVIIIVWIIWSLFSGLKMGFIYKSASILGYVVGLWVASRYTPQLAEHWNLSALQLPTLFFLIMAAISKAFGLLAWIVDKIFKIVPLFPFLKTFNRVLGGLLGMVLAVFMASSLIYFANTYAPTDMVKNTITDSAIATRLLKLSIFYKPLISEKMDALVPKQPKTVIPSADIEPK